MSVPSTWQGMFSLAAAGGFRPRAFPPGFEGCGSFSHTASPEQRKPLAPFVLFLIASLS